MTDTPNPSVDLDALREAAKLATPGPWAATEGRIYRDDADWSPFAEVFNGTEHDAAYIALSANFTRTFLEDPAAVAGALPVSVLAGALLAKECRAYAEADPQAKAFSAAYREMQTGINEHGRADELVDRFLRALSEQGDRGE